MRELGLDRLRGLGVFMVIVLHTAFYHFSGIYGVDLSNPSIIITLIGFLLMFAGLFAMISGAAYTLQYIKHEDEAKTRRLGMIKSGIALWIVAYVYFIVTGPGLIDFSSRSMDESILVALINQGRFVVPSLERWFYVDSLVMLSLNIILLAGFFRLMHKSLFAKRNAKWVLFIAIFFLVLSYVRIPLYIVYLEAVDNNHVILRVGLNYFVNKNNPIFPFFAFALFGVWWALLKRTNSKVLPHVIIVGVILLFVGVIGYILTPETMLERAIDPTWYFIMVMQNGLFLIFIELAKRYWSKSHGWISQFFGRFGIAGLTPFFIESTVSALIFKMLLAPFNVSLSIPLALLFGFVMASLYGIMLIYWEKKQYKYGIEWAIITCSKRQKESTKMQRMMSHGTLK